MGLSKSESNENSPNRQKKIVDVCDVHSKVSKQDQKGSYEKLTKNDCCLQGSSYSNKTEANNVKQESDEVFRLDATSSEKSQESFETELTEKVDQNEIENASSNPMKNNSFINLNDTLYADLPSNKMCSDEDENKMEDAGCDGSRSFPNSNEACLPDIRCEKPESEQSNFSTSSLPDIISTMKETSTKPYIDEHKDSLSLSNSDRTQNFSSLHNTKNITECVSKIPSVSVTRSAYLPYLYNNNSDVLSSENTHSEIKLPKSQPLFTNNSIYKLAFDESLTDQSDTESRSPSPIERQTVDASQIERYPVNQSPIKQGSLDRNNIDDRPIDPESQVPSSLMSHEINVYEAASDDDAGSEDLELIPHRYESESFLNRSKHLYENKLSLAVELLRTKESLPYDAQFKRVIEDSQEYPKAEGFRIGEINMGFVDDSNSSNSIELACDNFASLKSDKKTITDQCKTNKLNLPNSISYDVPLDDSLTNSYELADEALAQSANHQENKEEVNAGYRRIGVQFRHYFSPSSTLVNPWNCCTIM